VLGNQDKILKRGANPLAHNAANNVDLVVFILKKKQGLLRSNGN
jgi:hypothetical protein